MATRTRRFPLLGFLLLGFLSGLLATAARAQDPVNRQRGISANTAYQLGEIDAVNLYNGNLTVALPLGGTYPVSAGVSYGLALQYNSGVWELEAGLPDDLGNPTTAAEPEVFHNAGLGWRLSLGELFAPYESPYNDGSAWLYLAPDGSKHPFFPTLHDGDPVDSRFSYTRDVTYLRMWDPL